MIIRNGVIINGVVYDLVEVNTPEGLDECSECDIKERCFSSEDSNLPCLVVDDNPAGKAFKRTPFVIETTKRNYIYGKSRRIIGRNTVRG